jgi:hypothetical protein
LGVYNNVKVKKKGIKTIGGVKKLKYKKKIKKKPCGG